MADDLEAFLRQAAQRRSQRQKSAPAKPSPPQPRTPRSPSASSPSRQMTPVVEAVVVPEVVPSVVRSRVDTSGFEKRAEHLGEEVGLADEALETHLQEKFDHQVGTLSDDGLGSLESSEVFDPLAESRPTITGDIVAMLKNPGTVRQAILLSEIMFPPHHRW